MTNIDIKRLEWDADYWDEVAPEGATHAIPKHGYSSTGVTWFKRASSHKWKVWSRYDAGSFLRWCESSGTSDGPHFIPRPTKQAWGGGLPPVGVECELNLYGYWFAATVLAYGKTRFIYEISNGQVDGEGEEISGEQGGFLRRAIFRPIKSQHERQRAALKELLCGALRQLRHNSSDGFVAAFDVEETLDILSNYNLEPKP